MAADIETLLGMYDAPGADVAGLAKRLRGQQTLGNVLSMSTIPQAAQLGVSERRAAQGAAARGGALRASRAARDAQTERATARDSAAQAARDERQDYRAGRDAISDSRYAAGLERAAEQRAYDRSPAGSRGRGRGGLRGYKTILTKVEGVPMLVTSNRATGEKTYEFPGREDEGVFTREGLESELKRLGQREAGAAGAEKFAETRGTERAKAATTIQEDRSAMRGATAQVQNAIQALDEGAWTGPVLDKLGVTLRESTARLENARDKLALSEIGQYTFGSLSESESDWLKFTSLNLRQDPATLRASLVKRLEGIKRMAAANDYATKQLRANEEVDQGEIDQILYADGFTFAEPSPNAYPGGTGVAPGGTPAPPGAGLPPGFVLD